MVTTLDRDTLKLLRTELTDALVLVEKTHGVKIHVGSCSYAPDGSNATFKVEVAAVREDGTVVTKEAAAFKRLAMFYGFKPEHLGQKFKGRDGTEYTITGIAPKAGKYPLLAKRERDGVTMKFRAEAVVQLMGLSKPPGSVTA